MHKLLTKDAFYYGFPVALMTTKNKQNDSDNITPISSTWPLNRSLVIGLGLNNQGYHNLEVGNDLTLNIADETLWKQVETIAKTSGNTGIPIYKEKLGYRYCEDKFSLGNFTKMDGVTVSSARILECPIQIEATVATIMPRPDYAIIEADINAIYVDESILADESHIDVEKWRPLIYKFRAYTTANKHLGTNSRFQEFYK